MVQKLAFLDTVLPPVVRARLRDSPLWELEYLDGSKIVEDRDHDWATIPKDGTRKLKMYCPTGQVAVVGNDVDATGRLFQFKIGAVTIGGEVTREQPLVVIGIVTDAVSVAYADKDEVSLSCTCWAWDPHTRDLVHFFDTLPTMQFGGPVTRHMNLAVIGVDPAKV